MRFFLFLFLLLSFPPSLWGASYRASVLPTPALMLPAVTSAIEVFIPRSSSGVWEGVHLGLFHRDERGFFAELHGGGWEGIFDLRADGGWIFSSLSFLELGGGLYLQSSGRSVRTIAGERRYLREVRSGGEIAVILTFSPLFFLAVGEVGVTNTRLESGESFQELLYQGGGMRVGISYPRGVLGIYLGSSRVPRFKGDLSSPSFILGGFFTLVTAP